MAKGIRSIWIDSDSPESLGNKVIKDDVEIATVPNGVQEYKDPDVVVNREYKYVIQSYTATSQSTDEVLGDNLNYYTIVEATGLKPIITNFRVEDATPTHIHFDAPLGPVTGLTEAGFVISANTVTGINTTLGYIEVGTPFDSWNNNTIKLDGGNGVVYDFTMEHIENNIAEPSTSLEKFVAVGASGGGDSIGDPMDIELAYQEAEANTTYWCKAGDYGNVNLVVGNSGTDTQPVKFIGYVDDPGDITERPYDYVYNTPINVNAAPTISGPNSGATVGLSSAENYIIVKYLQAKDYYFNMYIPDTGSVIGNIWEGCTSHTPQTVTAPQNIDTCCFYNSNFSGFRNRITNSVAVNSSMNQFGSFSSESLIKGCFSYTDNLEPSGDGADYHMPIAGNDSIFVDNYIDGWATHGFSLKANGHDTERNLIVDSTGRGVAGGVQLRHRQVKNNVVKRVDLIQDGASGSGIMPRDGSSLNICESVKIIGGNYGVRFDDSAEDGGRLGVGFDNTFNNCIFADMYSYIYTGPSDSAQESTGNTFNNCTFDGANNVSQYCSMYTNGLPFGDTNIFNNCTISNTIGGYQENAYTSSGTNPPWASGTGGLIRAVYNDCNWFNNLNTISLTVVEPFPTDGNLDPQYDANYKPGNAALISGTKISGVNYDLNSDERSELTTLGAVMNDAEVVDPPLYPQSPYTEEVNIPTYDSGNPAHKLISADGDWSDINDPTITSFYVEPGDYTGAKTLSASGTSGARRYISLYNGNDLHPGQLPVDDTNLASVRLTITGDYWTIDRMSRWTNITYDTRTIWINGGSYNIINRCFHYNVEAGLCYIYPESHYNTVQNCRTERWIMTLAADQAQVGITVLDQDNVKVIGTKVLNNEFVNPVDAVQAIKSGTADNIGSSVEGTIIDYNRISFTKEIYSDGSGNQDDNGEFMYAENPFDLKCGSIDPENPIIISNNFSEGAKKSDPNAAGLSDNGIGVVLHYDIENMIIEDNVFTDCYYGIGASDARNGYAAKDVTIQNNIFNGGGGYGMFIYTSDGIIIDNNLMKNYATSVGQSYNFQPINIDGYTFTNNVTTNSGYATANKAIINNNNGWYNTTTTTNVEDGTDTVYGSDPTDAYSDYTITQDVYTNTPRLITVDNVIKP